VSVQNATNEYRTLLDSLWTLEKATEQARLRAASVVQLITLSRTPTPADRKELDGALAKLRKTIAETTLAGANDLALAALTEKAKNI
jgi:hypothetical protein